MASASSGASDDALHDLDRAAARRLASVQPNFGPHQLFWDPLWPV